MNCKKIEHKLLFHLEGHLNSDEHLLVASHLDECNSCSKKHDFLRSTMGVIESQKITTEDPFFYTRTLQKKEYRETPVAGMVQRYLSPVLQILMVAASIAAGVFIGISSSDYGYSRDAFVNAFAEDYYLFETTFEPLEAVIFTEENE